MPGWRGYLARRAAGAAHGPGAGTAALGHGARFRGLWANLRRPVVLVGLVIAIAAPLDTAALMANNQVVLIERGLTTAHNPQ